MFCKQCGTQLDDKALFCKNCGAKTDNAQQPVQQAQPVQQPVYQQPVQQAQPVQQPVYQQPVPQQAYPAYQQTQPVYQQPYVQQAAPAPKKSNGKLIAIIIAAVAVVAAIVVALILILGGDDGGSGSGTGGSGGKSEPTEAGGTKDNLDLGSEGSANAMIGGLQNIITSNGADFEVYFIDGYDEFEVKGSVLFDLDKNEITLDAEANIEGDTFGAYIYDGYVINAEDGEVYAEAFDMDDMDMSQLTQALEMAKEYDIAGMVFNGDTIVSLLEEAIPEEEREMVEMFMSFDDLADGIDTFMESINDEEWLEDNLDEFSRTDKNGVTTISLEISSFKFVGGIVDIFLPIFNFDELEAMAGESIDEDMLREQLDMMIEDELGDMDFLVSLDIVIEDDFVTDFELLMDVEGERLELKAHLDNVGNPTIDEDKLADLLAEAEIYE